MTAARGKRIHTVLPDGTSRSDQDEKNQTLSLDLSVLVVVIDDWRAYLAEH